jgi:hypothetical protein
MRRTGTWSAGVGDAGLRFANLSGGVAVSFKINDGVIETFKEEFDGNFLIVSRMYDYNQPNFPRPVFYHLEMD